MKKKKKTETQEGTITLLETPMSGEDIQKWIEYFEKSPCRFDTVLKSPCKMVDLEQSYWGKCPHCHEYIYTKYRCPNCKGLIDFS